MKSTAAAIFTFVAGVIAAESSGCSKTSLPDDIELGKPFDLDIDSTSINDTTSTRNYRIQVPKSYKPGNAVPLMLSFHGRTKTAKNQYHLSQFSNSSFGFEGIAVYPQGIKKVGTDSSYQWQGDVEAPSYINDVKFTLELIDHVEKNYCINTSQIYASGKSNGGGFTGLLACDADATKKIAAFAAVSGAWYLDKDTQQLPACNPSRKPIPFLEFHGIIDDTIKYEGGNNSRDNGNTTNIPAYINAWAERDGLDVNANKTGTLCSGYQEVTTFKWGETLQHYRYSNFGHWWMSEFGNSDKENVTTCKEAAATSVILKWIQQWSL
ncbi:alpha/beta-hydrolase [Massarina eburnea CBS 473.64]|uniref:feruloyl esterase n=1 Tax=Massarina eburnea CBS 473.64 TaxID=1395130 RepID=A0A6A6RXT5_9PLEO|nr:alpha/beta-hydrolase [Massarina eburnea CBS 473.64]